MDVNPIKKNKELFKLMIGVFSVFTVLELFGHYCSELFPGLITYHNLV